MELVAGDLDLHGDVDLMRCAEEGEGSVDLEGGVAGGVEGSGEAGGGEGDGFEGRRLLARRWSCGGRGHGVAALAAEGVDDDGAGGFAGGGIEGDLSLLDVEGAVDGVEGVGEGEVDFAAGGVEGEFVLPGPGGLRAEVSRMRLQEFRERGEVERRDDEVRLWSMKAGLLRGGSGF